jgi:hypothetical protein
MGVKMKSIDLLMLKLSSRNESELSLFIGVNREFWPLSNSLKNKIPFFTASCENYSEGPGKIL